VSLRLKDSADIGSPPKKSLQKEVEDSLWRLCFQNPLAASCHDPLQKVKVMMLGCLETGPGKTYSRVLDIEWDVKYFRLLKRQGIEVL
jgi:hypothetical protein